MWPWGHLAVGYLLYTGASRRWFDRPPRSAAALAVAFGTQFPDLVDKPLAWSFDVLASGRSLAHSLLVAGVVCWLVVRYTRRTGRPAVGAAFAVGYLSHPFADAVLPVLSGEYGSLAYFGWPVFAVPPDDTAVGLFAYLLHVELTPFVAIQFALVVIAFVVWLYDGHPGPAALRGWFGSWRERATEQ